jgi:hypothetical protein
VADREAAVSPKQSRELRSRSLMMVPVSELNIPMLSTEGNGVKLDVSVTAAEGRE